jgi:hypothetical protein
MMSAVTSTGGVARQASTGVFSDRAEEPDTTDERNGIVFVNGGEQSSVVTHFIIDSQLRSHPTHLVVSAASENHPVDRYGAKAPVGDAQQFQNFH